MENLPRYAKDMEVYPLGDGAFYYYYYYYDH